MIEEQLKKASVDALDETISTIQDFVRINSVRDVDHKVEGGPFGPGIKKALELFIEYGNKFGMRTFKDPEGYYGYVEIGPKDAKEMIGIAGHLDTVPAGDEKLWTEASPFSGDIVNDTIVGRGSLDDKGPVFINLIAMKKILDLKIDITKRIRLIVGTAEETTWEGMNKYLEKEELPTIGYSPDADYPLIHAEKTIAQFDASNKTGVDFTLKALGAYNAVPDSCIYTGDKVELLEKELKKLDFQYEKDQNFIKTIGQGAHAMSTELGVNAISRMCIALNNIGETCDAVKFVAEKVQETYGAELIQGKVEEEVSGVLKFNLSRIDINKDGQYLGMDSRIPVLIDEKEILDTYQKALEAYNLKFEIYSVQDKLYIPEDSYLVQTLLNTYKEVTGDTNAKPKTSGGGTYARAFDNNVVAFGSVFQDENMIDKMHQPNECFEIKFISKSLEIYLKALYKLAE